MRPTPQHLTWTRYAFSACAAIALLAGCNSSSDPPQSIPAVARGFTTSHDGKNREELVSTSGTGHVHFCGMQICAFDVTVSGNAHGVYPGTFTGGGSFAGGHFVGGFTITSGTNTITGSFDGKGYGGCRGSWCHVGGNVTYKATLEPGGKTFSGAGSASMTVFPNHMATMDVSLKSF